MQQSPDVSTEPIELNMSAVAVKLREIADDLLLESSRISYWLPGLLKGHGSDQLARAVADLNVALEPRIAEIASLTQNSESALRSVFEPKRGEPLMQWFRTVNAAEFLRCVAQYESFNRNSWRDKGWKGWGLHEELADDAHVQRRAIASDSSRQSENVEVFHWNIDEKLYGRSLSVPLQNIIGALMRGQQDVAVEALADAAYFKEHGLTWRKVAEVEGKDMGRAFEYTNHISGDWTLNEGVQRSSATFPDEAARSTSVGDIMRVGGDLHVVHNTGFKPLPIVCTLWLDQACSLSKPSRTPRP